MRAVKTNGQGLYAFPALIPGSYTLKVDAKNFQTKAIIGITLHAGDVRTIPALALTVGAETTTVTVDATAEMIPTENGSLLLLEVSLSRDSKHDPPLTPLQSVFITNF